MFGFSSEAILFSIPALIIAFTVHEYAHARMAVWLGDNTPKIMGRLTLNPLAHLDPLGLLLLVLVKFGWAKPVPFNPNNFDNKNRGTMLVALAGPASNVIMAVLTMLLLVILFKLHLLTYEVKVILSLTYIYNLNFAIFNMIPLPPLDGAKVLSGLLPWRQAYQLERIEPYSPFILLGLLYLGIISLIVTPFYRILDFIITSVINIIA